MIFAACSLAMILCYHLQFMVMTIFKNCPICGEVASVIPELGDKEYRVFQCKNGHQFKKKKKNEPMDEDDEIWDHMPEWAKKLNEIRKTVK